MDLHTNDGQHGQAAIAPKEFCLLLKQVDRRPPRLSRDLEPDVVGIELKQRILDAAIAADPPAADFERALLERAAALDLPAGAARGICSDILLEWRMAHASPGFVPWLRAEAARPPEPRKRRREDRAREPEWRERPQRGFGIPPAE
jgi:hypothetical protein